MLKSLSLTLLLGLVFSVIYAQDAPTCSSSTLQLQTLDLDFTEARASFLFSTETEVVAYELLHEFTRDGEEIQEVVSSDGPLVTIHFSPDGIHTFTAVNTCEDGTFHTGSSLILDFGQEGVDFQCPTPTNLFIETFTPTFVTFGWDNADTVDFWQVTYQPEGQPDQTFQVGVPFVEQDLLPTIRHTFSLYAVCDEEMLTSSSTQTVSPTVTFSLIIVEDVKLTPTQCDSLTELTCDAFLMESTQFGAFESDKEAFLLIFGCDVCTTNTTHVDTQWSLIRSWEIAPNPALHELRIQYLLTEPSDLRPLIFDAAGRLVKEFGSALLPAGEGALEVPIDDLDPGVYWVVLQGNEHSVVKKMIKAN